MMFTQRDEIGLIMILMLVIVLAVLIRNYIKHKRAQFKRIQDAIDRRAQQEQNIYNISGRVPNTNANQYPDAYLSVQHIAITNELNKPPKYDDAPPSYEDAIKMAIAQSNSLQTLQAEQTLRQEGTSSNSSSTPAVAHAVACPAVAVPNRTTE